MTRRLLLLARSKRALLAVAALLCYVAAIVLAPSNVRSQFDPRPHEGLFDPQPPLVAPPAPVAPQRDAFAPRATVADDAASAAAVLPLPLPTRLPVAIALPPRHLSASRVTAIATGTEPAAVIEIGGEAQLLTIGDPLEGSTITTIDDDAVGLANGRRLSLEPVPQR